MAVTRTVWQYHRERVPYDADPLALLENLGAQGWELVAVYESEFPPPQNGRPLNGRVLLFKRPK